MFQEEVDLSLQQIEVSIIDEIPSDDLLIGQRDEELLIESEKQDVTEAIFKKNSSSKKNGIFQNRERSIVDIFFEDMRKIPPLPEEDLVELIKVARTKKKERKIAKQAAKKRIVEANLNFVYSIARKYTGRGLGILDLMQEGANGLFKALKKFKLNKNNKFSTYAYWWVKDSIVTALANNKSGALKISSDTLELLSRVEKVTNLLSHELNRKPTSAEIAERMGKTIKWVEKLRKVKFLKSIYISTPLHNDGVEEFGDLLTDLEQCSPEEETGRKEFWMKIAQVLSCDTESKMFEIIAEKNKNKDEDLSLKEAMKKFKITSLTRQEKAFYVIARRQFGDTLREIGDELGVSHQRISAIEKEATEILSANKDILERFL